MVSNCPCGHQAPFENCCGRFLDSNQSANTPEQLMRSRYSAFACGGYGQYLLDTWLPSMAKEMTAAELSRRSVEWLGLEVLNDSENGDDGLVEFQAIFLDEDGERRMMHEKSVFKRVAGKWLYVRGEVDSS